MDNKFKENEQAFYREAENVLENKKCVTEKSRGHWASSLQEQDD